MPSKSYITYTDALKTQAPAAFSSMFKPIGSACNLECTYCYYLDKTQTIYNNIQPLKSLEILEEYTRQYIEANEVPEVTFTWHGGEPLMAGLDYFRKAMGFQRKHSGGKTIINSLQTNGTLLNADWCRFFNDHRFLIGVSIDGPRDIHDAYRIYKAGRPTFDKVMDGINQMAKFRVE